MRDLATVHIARWRLHGAIGFDRTMLNDPRGTPPTLSAAYGALSAENIKFLRAVSRSIDATKSKKEPK